MSKTLNISVLVAARDEYIEQLKCIIAPLILQGINSIYQDALNISEGKKTIYKFQELLKQIPNWNQTILQEEAKRIKKKCNYIMDIVTAIFVSNVKILASIRLKGKNENIKVKIPTSEIFIHSIYIESAQRFFYDPFLFHHKIKNFGQIQKNRENAIKNIRDSVSETIRQMLPFDNILQEYLANALNDDSDGDSDDSGDDSGEDSGEDSGDSLNGDNIVNDTQFLDEDEDEYSTDEENNVKNINTGGGNIPSRGSEYPEGPGKTNIPFRSETTNIPSRPEYPAVPGMSNIPFQGEHTNIPFRGKDTNISQINQPPQQNISSFNQLPQPLNQSSQPIHNSDDDDSEESSDDDDEVRPKQNQMNSVNQMNQNNENNQNKYSFF